MVSKVAILRWQEKVARVMVIADRDKYCDAANYCESIAEQLYRDIDHCSELDENIVFALYSIIEDEFNLVFYGFNTVEEFLVNRVSIDDVLALSELI